MQRIFITLVLSLSACGPMQQPQDATADTTADVQSVDVIDTQTPTDTQQDSTPACETTFTCNGVCSNVVDDPMNCGFCGNVCPDAGACVAAICR